ncbi:hypothetical protein NX059_007113 [Plenodomus lindquistii]|nr:hypothetical protein NX059_007113 [Plenodomus lindquistii]
MVAQERFWSLEREPLEGFRHAFFTTRGGVQLHYITNNVEKSIDSSRPVIVFIHGFPDSCFLWRHILQSPNLNPYTLIALDLPGYGGSDSLPLYNASHVLEALTEFLFHVRSLYLPTGGALIAVTHDWGSLIAARLASETKDLVHHWILTSGMIPHLTVSNAEAQAALGNRYLSSWTRSPFHFSLAKEAWRAYEPVLKQFRRSFYVFGFMLPGPLAGVFATYGNYAFLRACHGLGINSILTTADAAGDCEVRETSLAESMAISTGPARAQILGYSSDRDGHVGGGYGKSVLERIHDRGMAEKIGIYRNGFFTGEWVKSRDTVAALEALSHDTQYEEDGLETAGSTAPKGALRAPATILYAECDPAFVQALVLGNVADYLAKGSEVHVIPRAGHW